MRKYKVTGMSCAACSMAVERAVKNTAGVDLCVVNLLTGTLSVEGDASDTDIILAVTGAGYGASVEEDFRTNDNNNLQTAERKRIVMRLFASAVLMLILMATKVIALV